MPIDTTTVVVSLLSSVGGGAVVALVNHWLSFRNERKKRLDELTIQRRIEAYKRLERGSQTGSDRDLDPIALNKMLDDFESAYAETMLLGTKREIELAQNMAVQLSTNRDSKALLPLLDEIRSNLRTDLRLDKAELGMNRFFRLHRNKN
ncbi:MAG: hypothetical protein P4L82_15680 [Ancalomicrobiaceae bacterium]|nr:hypothetical protein [Ancalomicrobiaceae bacterium]